MLVLTSMMDINSEQHLHCSVDKLVKESVKCFQFFNRRLNTSTLINFVNKIMYSKYFSNNENAYHNLQHTFEVFQMTTQLMKFYPKGFFSPEECTILQVAALCHDYGHTGIPNSQWNSKDIHKQIKKVSSCESELSTVVERVNASTLVEKSQESFTNQEICSYNEIMHIDKTIDLILKYRLQLFPKFSSISTTSIVTILILATDLSQHNMCIDNILSNRRSAHCKRLQDMILIIKLADISHVLRPFPVHSYWVYKLQNENKKDALAPALDFIASDTLFFVRKFVVPLLDIFIEKTRTQVV